MPVTEVPLGLNEAGLPLGVQVAAGRDRDHVAIAVAMELERAFGGWAPPGSRGPPRGGLRDGPGAFGRRLRPGSYWTVSSPSMPRSLWPSIAQ